MFLKNKREQLNLTQSKLGEYLGVSANTISRWERGDISPEHPKMLELAICGLELRLLSSSNRQKIEKLKAEVWKNLNETEKIFERIGI